MITQGKDFDKYLAVEKDYSLKSQRVYLLVLNLIVARNSIIERR